MEATELVLQTMREAGEPLNAGKIAEMSGLDRKVVDKAMAELKKEGLVDPRRSLGCMVVGRRSSLWLGHVLFILCDASGSYYATVLADELQNRLT